MGFGDKIKKLFGSNDNKDDEARNIAEKEIKVDEPIETKNDETRNIAEKEIKVDEPIETKNDETRNIAEKEIKVDEPIETKNDLIEENSNIKNFKYLDDLIHSGEEEVSLDYDIVLSDDEVLEYQNGIELDKIVYINGNGHTIDAKGKARIFKLNGKYNVLRNMTLKNGYSPFGGAIFIDEKTYAIIEDNCYFNDNKAFVDGGAVFTRGKVVIQDCHFNNNSADEDGGAIKNQGILEVSYCRLIGNECEERGGSIYSDGTLKLFESEFKDNIYHEGIFSVYHSGGFFNSRNTFDDKNMGNRFSTGKTIVETDRNFKYLDNLIKSGTKEIVLDSNIILNDEEINEYKEGITIEENDIVIDGNGFSIDARNEGRIFTITGHNVLIKNITLKNAVISGYSIDFSDNQSFLQSLEDMRGNNIISGGAAIQNFGKARIESSRFYYNRSHSVAGAILNLKNASLELKDCEFIDNQAKEFAVISNHSELKIEDCLFKNNISAENGGVMENSAELEIINSKFINNNTSQTGAAIINLGNIKIYDSLFDRNYSGSAGGAILNQNGTLFVSNSCFKNNFSLYGGGILNFDTLTVVKSKFINNISRTAGGAIFNYEIGKAKLEGCEFKNNDSFYDGSCIYNLNQLMINESIFEENTNDNDIIFNAGNLELFGLTFRQNNANSLIININGAKVNANEGKAIGNTLNISSIVNHGEFDMNGFTFDNNHSNTPFAENIYNESKFYLPKVKILNENENKTILNKGYLDVKELTKSLEKTICNEGELKYLYRVETELASDEEESKPAPQEETDNPFNFNHLEDLINSNDSIELNENISILDTEIDFYEGGIELDKDNLTIDGKNKCIDGCGKSRIFTILGKDIVLKNIIFKNGNSLNNPYGGGAINIVRGASLKLVNCKFIDNSSSSDGGAVLNNGELKSIHTDFEGNKAKVRGGAIFNNGILTVEESTFLENKSKSGSSIYNNNSLNITSIDFDNEIFNNYSMISSRILEENVTNIGFINREKVKTENFTYLFNEIKESNEISLEKDIIFNYIEDKDLVNGFEITENIIINGNEHIIDGNGSARLFNALNNAEIVFKDVIFMNCYSSTQAIIENNSSLTLENCRFINNHPKFNESLIENNDQLKIIDCNFSNHYIKNNSLLINNENVEIKNSSFIGNSTESKGSVLSNFNKTDIKNSRFENNFSKEIGGAILNSKSGRLDILSTDFIKNISDEYGGAIFNYGESIVFDSQFLNNFSKGNGGALYNVLNPKISGKFVSDFIQNLLIDGCDFKNNDAGRDGGALYNAGVMDLQVSDFIENTAVRQGGAIYMGSEGIAYIGNCSFKKNKANDGGAIYQPVDNIRYSNCSLEDNTPNDTNLL